MKISYNWLKEYIKTNLPAEKISEILTDCGLEVESMEEYCSVKGGLEGIVIGEVLTKEKHPNADKLNLTTVNVGDDNILKIVCGASNVEVGQKVPVATIGATLYKDKESFSIKESKIRGELSQGMICAEDELGLGISHDGIMVLDKNTNPGTLAKDYFNVYNDIIIEIGLTPNRSDATSHFGVARDLYAALLKNGHEATLVKPSVEKFKINNKNNTINIEIENPDACPRYAGLTISNIKIKESPIWLKNYMKAIGLNPINNVVDITNFILHETGQPLHAFDADYIEGKKVIVKKLKQGTKFITLDSTERTLSENDLMICNANEGMCIAGVFGGMKSGITEKTKNVFLECAYFNPVTIRKTSKFHDIKTDSSFRFERGTDPNNIDYVIKRAALLINELAEGEISSEIIDIYPKKIEQAKVTLSYFNLDRLIGKKINCNTIKNILKSLDIQILEEKECELLLSIPTYRVDVTREADVIEEILRIYGMNNIDFSEQIKSSLSFIEKPNKEKIINTISNYLVANGFVEIMNNSLSKLDYTENSNLFNSDKNVNILNPLSNELNVMRQTLLFGGLESISYNINRQGKDLKLFENGFAYSKDGKNYIEKRHISLLTTGNYLNENWKTKDIKCDYYYLKGIVNQLIKRLGLIQNNIILNEIENEYCKEGLEYKINNNVILEIVELNNQTLEKFGINQQVFYANIYFDNLFNVLKDNILYKPLAKHPEVRRDLALIIDEKVKFSELKNIAINSEKHILKSINIFDVYKGKNIEEGKKSYALSFILQDEEKTLTDKQIEKTMGNILKQFEEKVGAKLR